MITAPPITLETYRQLVLEVGDRLLNHVRITALEVATARAHLDEPSERGHVSAALDRAIAELDRADRDTREMLAAVALQHVASLAEPDEWNEPL